MDINNIKEKIHTLENKKIMLDYDLAQIYGYEVKRFNEQIKRNITKFPSGTIFRLKKEELIILLEQTNTNPRSQIATMKITAGKNIKYLPNAFLFEAILALPTILKSSDASKITEIIKEAFTPNHISFQNEQDGSLEPIENFIHVIRGEKVMLDYDLAKIYGYDVSSFNQQVKRNIEKFPKDFTFQLTKDELEEILKSKIVTASLQTNAINDTRISWGGRRTLPYAFTEQGIYMLMTVLKGELATKQSIALIRLFKTMKNYIVENRAVLNGSTQLIEAKFTSYDKRFETIESKLEIVMDNFIDPSTYKHFLILDGEKIEADIAYQKIFSLAKFSLIIVDDYINIKTLEHLKKCNKKVKITILSDNVSKDGLTNSVITDFKDDTKIDIEIRPTHKRFHDRYIILDYGTTNQKIYLSGSSLKDSGNKITTIIEVEPINKYLDVIDEMIKK